MPLSNAAREFILHWGEMGSRWGVNRTVAQVHALLYLSPEPLTAEDIADALSVARSNVSTSLGELQGWGIIQTVNVLGDRRDHYESLHDVWELFRIVLDERKRREMDPTLALLRDCVREVQGWMEAAGGRNNAWTSEDRTDYFDIAPAAALPLLLWLEADRMRDLGPLIDQDKLGLQRDVVRNERRQSIENRPYGVEELELPKLLWPEGHPYHHPVIGSHEDLEAAGVGDVRQFFATWYDPSNASLVIVGDFDPEKIRPTLDTWFGSMPSHGKPADPGAPGFSDEKPTLRGVVRATISDNVELTKVTLAWQSPKHFAPGDAELDLVASVLAHGKESRLYKALVYDHPLAQEVHADERSLGDEIAKARLHVEPTRFSAAHGSDQRPVSLASLHFLGTARTEAAAIDECIPAFL